MPTESVDSLNSVVSGVVVTDTDEIKILNTDVYKPNITNEVKENAKNDLKSSLAVPDDLRKHLSTSSLDSNNVSIVTLDDNCDDSSVVDSDEDCEDVLSPNEMRATATNGIVLMNDGSGKVTPEIISHHDHDAPKLNIGSIAVQNSSKITFGNKTFYQGPVTIKQFLYENNKWKATEKGNENPAFSNDSNTHLDQQQNNGTGKVPTAN